MPGIILNTVLSIRAHCYLCFNFAIIIVCNRHPMRKTQLAPICRLCGWFPWALLGLFMCLQSAGRAAVGWCCCSSLNPLMCLWLWLGQMGWLGFTLHDLSSSTVQTELVLMVVSKFREKKSRNAEGFLIRRLRTGAKPLLPHAVGQSKSQGCLESQDQGTGSTTAWKEMQNHIAIGWL